LILTKLKYKIQKNNFIDFVNILFNENFSSEEGSKNYRDTAFANLILAQAKTFYKMTLLNYSLLRGSEASLIYSGIFYYAVMEVKKNVNFGETFQIGAFWKSIAQFGTTSEELLKIAHKIKIKRPSLESKEKFPYFVQYELSKYKKLANYV